MQRLEIKQAVKSKERYTTIPDARKGIMEIRKGIPTFFILNCKISGMACRAPLKAHSIEISHFRPIYVFKSLISIKLSLK